MVGKSIFLTLIRQDGSVGQGRLEGATMVWSDDESDEATETAVFTLMGEDGSPLEVSVKSGDFWREFESSSSSEALISQVARGQSMVKALDTLEEHLIALGVLS